MGFSTLAKRTLNHINREERMAVSKRPSASDNPFPAEFAAMDPFKGTQGRSMSSLNGTALKGIESWHNEVSRFVAHRIKKNMELQTALGRCGSASDAFEACVSHWQDMVNEYWEESAKLSEISAKAGMEEAAAIAKTDLNGGKKK